MIKIPHHTIYLQDGSLFNFKRRFKNYRNSLIEVFSQVGDGRSKFGKQHPLPLILFILFGGMTAGYTTIKDCRLWFIHNKRWAQKFVIMPHGVPDERTLSRAIQKTDIDSLVTAFTTWNRIVGITSFAASFDGKTMRGVHRTGVIRHMLSLFTHTTHQILGQIGVSKKENEISAFHRLLEQVPGVAGILLLGDALHTQKETVNAIIDKKADYLLFAKGNQQQLMQNLYIFFTDVPFGVACEQTTYNDDVRERKVTTTITISHDKTMCSYLAKDWKNVITIGKLNRAGTRKTTEGKIIAIDETYFLISSRHLTAEQVALHTRNHWQIENNLHWQKDWTFLEDKQTLRSGNAPQVMSFLRSMCISLFATFKFTSVSGTVKNFQMEKSLHHQFLSMARVV